MQLTGRYLLWLFACWLALPQSGYSRQPVTKSDPDSTIVRLQEVVINGASDPVGKHIIPSWLLSPASVDAADALERIPGLSKVQSNNYPIVYRGQYGNRLRIEQNGNRRPGVTPEGGYMSEDINPGTIREIRMVSGAEKAIYGSGASGGVLKIDQFGSDANGEYPQFELFTAYGSNNRSNTTGFQSDLKKDQFGIMISGRHQTADNYQTASENTILNSAYYRNNASARVQYRDPKDKHTISLSHAFSNGDWERPQGFQANPLELRNFNNRYTHQTSVNHTLRPRTNSKLTQRLSLLLLSTDQVIDSYGSGLKELLYNRTRNYRRQSLDYEASYHYTFNDIKVNMGVDVYQSQLDEKIREFNLVTEESFPEEQTGDRKELQTGLFLLADRNLGRTDIRTALRYDAAQIGIVDSSSYFHALTGAFDLQWKPVNGWQTVLSVGRYFRYPTSQEALGEFIGGRGVFLGNPEIRPEYSHQAEWTITGNFKSLQLQATGYYHHFNGRITPLPTQNGVFLYQNVENARTMGAELIATKTFGNQSNSHTGNIVVTAGVIRGDILEKGIFSASAEPLIGIPPANIRLSGNYERKIFDKNTIRVSGDISKTADFDRLPDRFVNQTFAVVPTEGYWLSNIHTEIDIKNPKVSYTAGLSIRNLTNSAYFPFGTRVMEIGRNFLISCSVKF